jgi:hypothetical protein
MATGRSTRSSQLVYLSVVLLLVGCGARTSSTQATLDSGSQVDPDSRRPDRDGGQDSGQDAGQDVVDAARPSPWTSIPLSVSGGVYALWASADGSSVWAVGQHRHPSESPIVWRFDGVRFVEVTPPALRAKAGALTALWGSAKGEIWTAGSTLHPWHFDGALWREMKGGLQNDVRIEQIRGRGEVPWLVGHRNVYVTGDQPALHSWVQTGAGIALDPASYPTWAGGDVALPLGQRFAWKGIKRAHGGVSWERGDNRPGYAIPAVCSAAQDSTVHTGVYR